LNAMALAVGVGRGLEFVHGGRDEPVRWSRLILGAPVAFLAQLDRNSGAQRPDRCLGRIDRSKCSPHPRG